MRSAADFAKSILTGWRLSGTRVDVRLRSEEMDVDSSGVVSGFTDSDLVLALPNSGRVRLSLSDGLTLAAFTPPERSPIEPDKALEFVAGVVILRGDAPVCVLIEPSQSVPSE